MTGAEAKAIRERLGLTQAQLARAIGLAGKHAHRSVRAWEVGQRGGRPVAILPRTEAALRALERQGSLSPG